MQNICCIKPDGYMHMFCASLMKMIMKQSISLLRLCSCAGTCEYGNGAPIIKLSAPLMRYRTNDDLKVHHAAAIYPAKACHRHTESLPVHGCESLACRCNKASPNERLRMAVCKASARGWCEELDMSQAYGNPTCLKGMPSSSLASAGVPALKFSAHHRKK